MQVERLECCGRRSLSVYSHCLFIGGAIGFWCGRMGEEDTLSGGGGGGGGKLCLDGSFWSDSSVCLLRPAVACLYSH